MRSNFTIKVPDEDTVVNSGVKLYLVITVLNLAGRYGKHVLLVLLAVAYVSACLKAFSITIIAIALMLPILLLAALYIAVSEEVDR